jgi:hypothetical protein
MVLVTVLAAGVALQHGVPFDQLISDPVGVLKLMFL